MAESLGCSPEMITAMSISYTPIQIKSSKNIFMHLFQNIYRESQPDTVLDDGDLETNDMSPALKQFTGTFKSTGRTPSDECH